MSNNDFQRAIQFIEKSEQILLTTHFKPDGDACGCIAAVQQALKSLGKKVKILLLSSIPQWYQFLFDEKIAVLGDDISFEQLNKGEFAKPDLIIILDTNSYAQLPKFDEYLKQNDIPILIMDHHKTADGLGEVELVDTSAAATALIVYDLLKFAGWPITKKIAQALFVAISTDTGWFQFDNTDARAVRASADLIEIGVSPTKIYHDLYQSFSPQRIRLMTAMLNTLELHFDGRYAAQHLTRDDFKRTGADYNDTENLIDESRRIDTVEAAALFVELPDGRIKVSLRSRAPVDVRRIAERFNGGGHTMAAGLHLPGPLENAKKTILKEFQQQLK